MTEISCIFCSIVEKKIPARLVFESKDVVAFHDVSPIAPVHILIVPKVHVASINHITDGHDAVMSAMVRAAQTLASDLQIAKSGYRLVVNTGEQGGQTVHHLHLHLLGGRDFSWPPG